MRDTREPAPTARITPAQRKRYDKLVEELARARRQEAGGWDRYWEAVGELLSSELFRISGAKTAAEWLEANVEEPYRTAMRNVRVAQFADPDDEATWGVTKLDAAIGFVEAKLGAPADGKVPIAFGKLRIPVVRDGDTRRLGLGAIETPEIVAATDAIRRDEGKARTRGSPVEQAFVSALRSVAVLRTIRVRVVDGHVSLGHIPLPHLDVAFRTIAKVDWRALSEVGRAAAKRKATAKKTTTTKKPKTKAGRSATTRKTATKKRPK